MRRGGSNIRRQRIDNAMANDNGVDDAVSATCATTTTTTTMRIDETPPSGAFRIYKRDLVSRHILISGMPVGITARAPTALRKYQLAKYRTLAVAINATQIFSLFADGAAV